LTEKIESAALIEAAPAALQLSDQAIGTVKRNIQLCEQLVQEVLEPDIDFGTIPGVPQPFLWDSGAAKIMAAFNCYASYKVIDSVIQIPHIRYTITSHLINRQSQHVVATGIGAASTKEVKHRYRWVEDPEKEGIARKGLKQRKDKKFRIPNPETEDLLNTIAKMAAKRADVDAAQSLPGVAATLRKLFTRAPLRKPGAPPSSSSGASEPGDTEPIEGQQYPWRFFEAKLATLGVSHAEARDILGVHSIKDDWVGVQGKTLDEAYEVIKAAKTPPPPPKEAESDY